MAAESSEPGAEGDGAPTEPADLDAVAAANEAFYAAFESRDLDAMSEVWEHSERVSIVHPGWPILRGWASVSASWFALFDGPQRLQFILTDTTVHVIGDVAWVTGDENLIQRSGTEAVAATNVFARHEGRWLLVHHHGSPVVHQARGRDS